MIPAEAGVTIPVTVEIANRGDEADRFEVEIEGLDPEWTAIPVPVVSIDGREIANEKVFFKPGRVSESVAGNYPFVLKVRSMTSGESRSVQGVLQINPFYHLSAEMSPKKGTFSPSRKQNVFTVSFMNLGNTEHTIQLFGNDPDDQCSFDFDQERVVLPPGTEKSVVVTVNPNRKIMLGSSRLHGFSIGARSIEAPSVVCSAQGQLEQRPLLTPSSMLAASIALLLILILYITRPQPPALDSLMLSKSTVTKGEEITISWHASNARGVTIKVGESELYRGTMLSGSKTFVATESGVVVAQAWRDAKQSTPETAQYNVTAPVVAADPEVLTFDVSPKTVAVGQTLTVRYKFSDSVTKATLAPRGLSLNPKVETIQFELDEPGTSTFYVVAENADGKTSRSRSITIKVQVVSAATVVVFRAEPSAVFNPETGGTVRIVWQLGNAVRAELSNGTETTPLPDIKGEMEVSVDKTTTFKLIGYDAKGMTVTSLQTITINPKDVPPPDETTTGGDGTGVNGGGKPN